MEGLGAVMASSLYTDMHQVNTAAHNLANVSTAGFKRALPINAANSTARTQFDQRQGALTATGADFDLALEGPGYFVVTEQNHTYLTRGGALRRDPQGRLLHAQSGLPLMSDNGEVIVPPGTVRIDSTGVVWQHDVRLARLTLAQPSPTAQLAARGQALYAVLGPITSVTEQGESTRVRQGYLEMSNVDSTQEMLRLMQASRHFESVQKALHGLDAMWDKTLRTLGDF